MSEEQDRQRFAIDGREPQDVVFPETVAEVTERLRQAGEYQQALAPVGHGAFLHLGGMPRRYDRALCLQRLNRVVDYQPTDMTVSVEAGMTLTRLQEILGEHKQWLPIDPPYPDRVTIGGIIAANLSGPARLSQGTIRDFLLGLTVVRADGTVVKGGGRVVKNVAGYDLPKLYCGSFGTLGVVVEATFKVRPRPLVQAVVSLVFPAVERAMELTLRLLGSELQPFFLELTNSNPKHNDGGATGYRLEIGFAGLAEEVSYQQTRLRELIGTEDLTVEEHAQENAQCYLSALRDFPVVGEAALRCRIGVVPTEVAAVCRAIEAEASLRALPVQLLAHAGNGIIYSRFTQLESTASGKLLSLVDWLRIMSKKAGGYMVVEQIAPALKERVDVWGHVGSAFPLMKRLKETLDPQGILNPGRFVGGI